MKRKPALWSVWVVSLSGRALKLARVDRKTAEQYVDENRAGVSGAVFYSIRRS